MKIFKVEKAMFGQSKAKHQNEIQQLKNMMLKQKAEMRDNENKIDDQSSQILALKSQLLNHSQLEADNITLKKELRKYKKRGSQESSVVHTSRSNADS